MLHLDDFTFDTSGIVLLEGEAKEKADTLRKGGVWVPPDLAGELQKPIPSQKIREWSWFAHFFPYPNCWNAPDAYESTLKSAQADWDKSERFVKGQLELRAEREAKVAAEEKAKADADKARREQEAAEVREELRERFMALPGTTEDEFNDAYPDLLADHRRQLLNAQAAGDDAVRQALRAATRGNY